MFLISTAVYTALGYMTWYGGAPWAVPLARRPRAALPGPGPLPSFALGGWAMAMG